ncbi:aldehyde dehydrogenase [Fragilaria crotonensis]|nr:aldehyde dehydrogenase [Fragilaria crotonensis]
MYGTAGMNARVIYRKDELNVEELVAPMYAIHKSAVNQTYAWRMDNLRILRKVHTEHAAEWQEALLQDLGKQMVESFMTEIKLNLAEIDYFLSKLKSLMKPTQASSMGYNLPCFAQVQDVPLRPPAVLIIGPSNYPLQLTLSVAAGALAAGNPVVIKPSELTPAVSELMAKLCSKYFSPGCLQVVQGGREVVTPLLQHEWAKIAFTGSERVGKIVAEAASKTLTPVLLELGGKSPCYVDEHAPANIRLAAQRIIWGKTLNSGQTCVSPDYLIVHETHLKESHAERHVEMLREVESLSGSWVVGGSAKCNPSERFTYPTLVIDPPLGCRLLTEEIFGPILPIVPVKSRKEAKDFINSMPGIPLSMYVFTSKDSVFREMISECRAASVVRNDVVIHFGNPHLPMSGLGSSGYGSYHGIHSWRCFTHSQSQVYRPCFSFADFGLVRYHPYGKIKEKLVMILTDLPALPPLHIRFWSILAVSVYAVLSVDHLRYGLADCMAFAVDWLRRPVN